MAPLSEKGKRIKFKWKLSVFLFLLLLVKVRCQGFRSTQNTDDYREPLRQYPYDLRDRPSADLSRYNTGNVYYGSVSRYRPSEFDDESRRRDFSNRYEDDFYRAQAAGGRVGVSRFDSRGRPILVSQEVRDLDIRKLDEKIGVLNGWRPDLQGELRPGEIPGENLPLADGLFVKTDSGMIQGFYVYLYDKPSLRFDERPANKPLDLQRYIMNVTVFLGIPYARPPIREGRFKPPRRVLYWHTYKQALDFAPACPQNLKYIGTSNGIRNGIDEDCLYLNIYTPSGDSCLGDSDLISVNVRDRYPVMFHIHGGDFDHGASNQFPGHMMAAWGEVVVVTFNYRLGALGFLSTGDDNSPGNYGLIDMAMALEWTYNNIRFFNGDHTRITVFGSGAGGAAAGLLAVLPKTKNWVNKVISESGSPLADWAAVDDVYRVQNTSRVYGLAVGCSVESSYKLMQCLTRRNFEELASAPIKPDVGTFAWSPVVDYNFSVPKTEWYEDWEEDDWHILPELPVKLYQQNHHHPSLRYLAGVNKDEAADMVFEDSRLGRNSHEVTEQFFDERIKEWVKTYNYSLNLEGAFDAIKWMYTFWPDPHNTTHIREQYVNMLSDALYKSGIDQLVKLLVNSTEKKSIPTYYYLLNTTVEALKLPYWREVPNNIEYYFISGAPFMDPELYPENIRVARQQWTEGDRNISEFMMKAFVNFAKWGNPTEVQVEILKVNWYPVIEGTLRYLSINTTFNTSMHYNYRQSECTFWYDYMPKVVREWIPTPPPPRNPWTDMTEPVTAALYSFVVICVVLIVMMLICFGLWKSAKRQRNKALDDLQYYSTENLSIGKESDFGLKNYIDKLNDTNHSEFSCSVTPNTTLSKEPIIQSQSTINKVQMNGKSSNMSEITPRINISEPDKGSKDNGKISNASQHVMSYTVKNNFAENLDHPPRSLTPVSLFNQQLSVPPEPLPRTFVNGNRQKTNTQIRHHASKDGNVSDQACKPLLQSSPHPPTIERNSINTSYEIPPPYPNDGQYQDYSKSCDVEHGQYFETMHDSNSNAVQNPPAQSLSRPVTPSSSNITFEISMKPKTTVLSVANGILNTEL